MLDVRNSRLEEAEEQTNDIQDKVMESNEAEQKTERRIMQQEDRLRELCDSIKHNIIHIIGDPEKKGKKIYLKK